MSGWRLEVSKVMSPMRLEPCQDGARRGVVGCVGMFLLCAVER